jgi:hypothetical protein
MARLYKILEKIRHLYKIDLPETIKVYPVFSLDRLWKAPKDPLLGQRNEPLLLIQVNDNDKWEVEEVLVSKLARRTL